MVSSVQLLSSILYVIADARLQLELSRQQHPVNRHTLLTSSLRRSSSLRSRKLSETHKI